MHKKVVGQILDVAPKKVVYVSCNPATQARDLALMNEHYKVTKVQPVDMFPQTFHVENVVLLEKTIMDLTKDFWNNRYKNKETGWDIGYASTPLKNYIDQLENKEIRILIPGCGNAYEAEYLHLKGFNNVFLLDIAPMALQQFSERVPDFPKKHLIQENFFEHQGNYNLILEQTFFCAIKPKLQR